MSNKLEVKDMGITARIPLDDVALIDEWRRRHPAIPTRSEFVRLAVLEKLKREGIHKVRSAPTELTLVT